MEIGNDVVDDDDYYLHCPGKRKGETHTSLGHGYDALEFLRSVGRNFDQIQSAVSVPVLTE